jgi:branched-chain amino acid transport system ATP-binding protein
MTVRENVQMALLSRAGEASRTVGAARARHVAAADALLDRVGLAALADRAAGLLAYGDLKRLDLAVALVGAPGMDLPRLLLMDEPTAGMAFGERAALMRLVRALATERGVAVLFTEHDMDVVFGVADRIVVLARGEIVASGDPAAIRADPRVRAVYLGADG